MIQNIIKNCLSDTSTIEVTETMLAQNVRSGDTAVLATPMLINIIEMLCNKIIKENLNDEKLISVGTLININHISPTPKSMKITIKATITNIDNNKVTFKIYGQDEKDTICTGVHKRVILEKDQFEKKANDKLK